MSKYKHLFFDLDGTLWDIHSNSRIALREIFFDLFPGSEEVLFQTFYVSYRRWNERLWSAYRKNQISKNELRTARFERALSSAHLPIHEELVELMAANFLEKCPTLPHLIAGAKEILEYCSDRYKMHIITNGFKEVQEIKMTSSGIIHYFQHFFYSEDLGVKKPHPAIFKNALNISQCSAEEALMIGDDWGADILGARNIGIDQVYLNTNNKLDRRHNYTPTYSINDLRNLKEIL